MSLADIRDAVMMQVINEFSTVNPSCLLMFVNYGKETPIRVRCATAKNVSTTLHQDVDIKDCSSDILNNIASAVSYHICRCNTIYDGIKAAEASSGIILPESDAGYFSTSGMICVTISEVMLVVNARSQEAKMVVNYSVYYDKVSNCFVGTYLP
jgi:hypothetical protein